MAGEQPNDLMLSDCHSDPHHLMEPQQRYQPFKHIVPLRIPIISTVTAKVTDEQTDNRMVRISIDPHHLMESYLRCQPLKYIVCIFLSLAPFTVKVADEQLDN